MGKNGDDLVELRFLTARQLSDGAGGGGSAPVAVFRVPLRQPAKQDFGNLLFPRAEALEQLLRGPVEDPIEAAGFRIALGGEKKGGPRGRLLIGPRARHA